MNNTPVMRVICTVQDSTVGLVNQAFSMLPRGLSPKLEKGPKRNPLIRPQASPLVSEPIAFDSLNHSVSSVQFSRSIVSDSLRPHESQHTRPRCPSPTPGVHSDSYPLSQWCHPAISYSIVPFFSWLQFFPVSGSFLMSQMGPVLI